jgi:hypothetical protein
MANTYYPSFVVQMMGGFIDFDSDTFKAVLTSGFAYNAAHNALDDIPAGQRVATVTVTSPTITASGQWYGADPVFTAPAAGRNVDGMVIYQQGIGEADSYLILYIDTGSGLPFTTNGENVTADHTTVPPEWMQVGA